MRLIVKENYEELSEEAAFFVKKQISEKPDLVLGLAAGATPLGLYQKLIEFHQKEDLDFSRVSTFNLDEYLGLPSQHPQSYRYFMWQKFFKQINIKKENVFILDTATQTPEEHCQWYEDKIKERGGIDLQILGIGRNGHIGFNEPGSGLDSRTRVVSLAGTTRKDNSRFFENEEEVPKRAITMGLATIMAAKKCLLLASGRQKREAIKKALQEPITQEIPASVLQKHSNLTVILDREAAGGIIE